MMKKISTLIVLVVMCCLFGKAQTNPAAQSIPFTFTTQTTSTLPAGMAVHRFGTSAGAIPTTRTLIPGNADLPYLATPTSGGWKEETTNGLSMLASGSQSAGALIVALNTTGQTNIQAQWTVRLILQQASRDNSIALQYRIGTSGNFTDIGTTTTYSSSGQVANHFLTFTETLPAAAENQALVQLRWIYWESAGTAGSRDRLAVDDINITATGGGDTNPPLISTLIPATTATNVPIGTNLQIIFSEPIAKGTGNILIKKISDNSIVQTIPVASTTVSGNTATLNNTAFLNSTAYYVEIPSAGVYTDIALNNFAGFTGNATWQFTTEAPITPGILNNNYSFTNCNTTFITEGWRQYSVLGNSQFWTCSNTGRTSPSPVDSAMVMNAFVATNNNPLNEDWLISPPFNLVGTSAPYLDFYSRTKFNGNGLVLKVSTNYVSGTNPNSATWTTLNGNFPAANTDVWTLSNNIDLTPFSASTNVFIAWVYINPTTAASSRWTLDDIIVNAGCTPPSAQPTALNLTPSIISIAGSFTASSPAADGYLVLMSTSSTLTTQPTPGTAYAIDDVIGNATVVSFSNNTSFTANNLTPNTPYYFFVYAYTAAQNCYQLVNPLTNNTSTLNSPVCTPPSTQASNLTATNITGTSMDINYTRGNGDNILVVARVGTSVNQNPIVGVNYTVGSQIGAGNIVIYNGPAATFNYASLTQSTTYYFALYEYFNTDYCYNLTPLTGNFTTLCTTPVNVSAVVPTAGNTTVGLAWTNPGASCYDEILVVASNAPITGVGTDYPGVANTVYSGPNQVVFRGIGTTVNITSLTNNTLYYFTIFTKNNGVYSSGVTVTATPFDPTAGFNYYYGNLHSHSSFSDGNKDNLTKQPIDDYRFGRDANCMDFLGISEHNHNTAGMSLSNYPIGYSQANTVNGEVGPTGNTIVTLWGMEWGVISGGGHVLTYGFDDQLIGWESGNYNIFCAKNDYASLFNLINNKPGAIASLAHPNDTDFGNAANNYSASTDNAVVGMAMESGPAFSTNTTYSDFPSQLNYFYYYTKMLSKGYKLGPMMDGDNHNYTFGRQSANRTVVLANTKTRADIMSALKNMRFYASNDCNMQVDFKCFNNYMGSSFTHTGLPTISINVSDPDAFTSEVIDSIYIYGVKVGDAIPTFPALLQPIKKYANTATALFDATDIANTQPDNTTYYYFAMIKQADGNRATTAPIWYTRTDVVVPITLVNITATYTANKTTLIDWFTAQEQNSKSFEVERSTDGGRTFRKIGDVNAKGNSYSLSHYQFTDLAPVAGSNLYRLKQIDINGKFVYSKIVAINTIASNVITYSLTPNPASEFAYLNTTSTNTQKINWQLYNETGSKLQEQNSIVDKYHPLKINLLHMSKGVHVVKIIDETNRISTLKLVVQ